jgi:acetyl-CoA acyltransferase 1
MLIILCECPIVTQAKKGGFKDTCPEELLAAVLKEAYTRAKLDPSKIE